MFNQKSLFAKKTLAVTLVLLMAALAVFSVSGKAIATGAPAQQTAPRGWTPEQLERLQKKIVPWDPNINTPAGPENTIEIKLNLPPAINILDSWRPPNERLEVRVNDQFVLFPDQVPFIDENNRTLVPVRFVAEKLGAEVSWNARDQIVGIKRGDTNISLRIGEMTATVNNRTVTFDSRAAITPKGRTMVPLRFVSETFGAEVRWNEEWRWVEIFLK